MSAAMLIKTQWRDILKHWLRQNAYAWPGWEGTTSLMNTPGSESPGTWLFPKSRERVDGQKWVEVREMMME